MAASRQNRLARVWRRGARLTPVLENDFAKRLIWSGLLAGIGALATIATTRLATAVWIRVFDEDPPEY